MNFLDLLTMSAGNLWRRKLRTILTVLGVVIGTASIVVMLSLGKYRTIRRVDYCKCLLWK